MKIRVCWWVHACVEIISADGIRLMIDPHDGGSIGVRIPRPPTNPHYILVTHRHFDHSAVDAVKGDTTHEVVIEKEGEFTLGPFRVRGVKLPHDEFGGRFRGFTVAYHIEVSGLTFTHLGDIGDYPPEDKINMLKADIVFVPAGGVYTIHPRDAVEILDKLEARIGVPIHYWVDGCYLPLEPLDTFLNMVKKRRHVVRLESNCFEVEPGRLPSEPLVYVPAKPR